MNKQIQSDSDSDGSIEEDDIEDLELNWLGILIQGEYIIVKYIGRGTFSRVWLSYHFKSKQFYILKIYFQEFEEEFEYEVEIYNKIQNIAVKRNMKMIDTTSYKNKPIIILPYMGLSLDELLDLKENISYLEFKYLCREILLGIQELHKLNIIHNDIKMDNILTDYYSEECVKFCDFIKTLKIEKLYDICYNTYKPENFHKLNKDIKKKIKKKIKPKINKLLSSKILDLILQYQEEQENYSELGSNIDLNDLEFNEENDINETLQLINLNHYENDIQLGNETELNNYISKREEKKLINIQLSDLTEINLHKTINNNENNDKSADKNDSENNDENNENDKHPDNFKENEKKKTINNKSKIQNILNTNIKIIDYSNSESIYMIDDEEEYQIRAFRSPENIMGNTYSNKSEIWALGCLFWYILTEEYIFEPELIGSSIERDYNQLILMEKYIGNIPEHIKLKCSKTFELFQNKNIKKKNQHKFNKYNSSNLLEESLKQSKNDFTASEINNICGLLKCIFVYNPNDRFTIQQCLNHPFFLF